MVPASSTRRSSDALSTRRDATAGRRPPTLGQGRILAGDCADTEAGHVPPHRPVIASPKKQLPCNRPRGFGGETLFIYPVRRWQPWKVPWHQGRALNPLLGGRAVPATPTPARQPRARGQGRALHRAPAHAIAVPQFPFPAYILYVLRAEPRGAPAPPPQTQSLPALVPPYCPVPISVPAVGDNAPTPRAAAGPKQVEAVGTNRHQVSGDKS